jgi:hypothetical protein
MMLRRAEATRRAGAFESSTLSGSAVTQFQQHITEPLLGFNADAPIVVDIPVGCGRERVAAMIEAATGCSVLGPHDPRVWREERARRVAEIRAALGRINPARKPRKPTLAGALKQAAKAGKSVKGAEVYSDRVVLQFGEPPAAADINPWDEVLTNAADQKRPS